MKIYSNKFGHMTKMDGMIIYGKNPSKIFFPRTTRLIALKLRMLHWRLGPIIVCSNDDPVISMTYFIPRSNLVT